jgi:colanic acid biosynthesis glycosyl transferase WcaI
LRKYDYIIAVTNPPVLPAFLGLMRKLIPFRYLLLLLDIFPEGLVALGKWKKKSCCVRAYKALNRTAYHNADKVFTVGRDMRELIIREYDVPANRVTHFPEWSSFEPAKGKGRNPYETDLCSKLNLRGKFIVQYSGNMALWHDMNTIVRAAKRLNKRADIAFVIIGGGVRLNEAQELAKDLEVQNIHWQPFQPKENLGDTLTCCHMALISQRKELEGIAVPCKIYGILASGRGVLAMAPKSSEAARIVRGARCGMVMESDDDELLANTILELVADPARVKEMGQNAFNEYESKYTLQSAVTTAQKYWK